MERHLFPLWMEWRLLKHWDVAEERVDEPLQFAIALAVGRPVVGGEHRWRCDRVDPSARLDEIGVIIGGQHRGQIIRLERLGIIYWNEMQIRVFDARSEL